MVECWNECARKTGLQVTRPAVLARGRIYQNPTLQAIRASREDLAAVRKRCGSAVVLGVVQKRVVLLAAESKPHTKLVR